jgi:zinc transporter
MLTLVATVALPLGLITGLLGVNVGGIPLEGSAWGFTLTCAALVLIAAAQVVLFKKMKWL